MSTISRAIGIAAAAHEGQLRKDETPYVFHPLRLMLKVRGEAEQIAAVLHDVVEDTEWTLEQVRAEGFPEAAMEALELLTHDPAIPYDEYIEGISRNPIARRVKIADLEDNMNLQEIPELTEKDLARSLRYHRHWSRLKALEQGAKTFDG